MSSLLDLPPELIEEILIRCDPVDVAKASMTCKKIFGAVYGSGVDNPENGRRAFWRELYLSLPLDDPRKCVNWLGIPRSSPSEGEGTIDWEKEVQDVIRTRTVVESIERCRGEEELRRVLRTLIRLVEWVPPSEGVGEGVAGDLATNLVWVPVVVGEFLNCVERGVASVPDSSPSSSAFTQNRWKLPPSDQWTKPTKQLHAQLHTSYGLTRRDLAKRRRVSSRAWVYDMRNYTPENEYGPLCDGEEGKVVDWEFLEKVHHVLSMQVVWENVRGWVERGLFEDDGDEAAGFEYMIYPLSMPFTQVVIRGEQGEGGDMRGVPMVEVDEEGGDTPEGADWAAIEGNWTVCFCFCDHRELIGAYYILHVPPKYSTEFIAEYNGSEDENGNLNISVFEDEEFTEVFRKLEVKLKVTRVANDPDHPGRPIIGFLGEMRAPSNSTMYGCVQLTADNHLKWQFVSSISWNLPEGSLFKLFAAFR